MTVNDKSMAVRKPFLFAALGAAAVVLLLIAVFLKSPRPGGTVAEEDKVLKQIKQEERILILYESVIGVKAKAFDGKLKTYQYGVTEQQLSGGKFLQPASEEAPLTGDLMSMEMNLQIEMDLLGLLIRQREELKEQVSRMHFQHKFNQGKTSELPPPPAESQPSPASVPAT